MFIDANPTLESALPLAEIALNAAIELDSYGEGARSTQWLAKLADALREEETLNVGLFPVYDRALTSSEGTKFTSKADVYTKLREITRRLASTDRSSPQDTELLRDFCIALHEALLSQGYLSHYKTVSNSRLHS